MRRLSLAMALLVAIILTPHPVAAHQHSWRWDECRFQGLQRGTWTAREELLTARCAIGKWPIPGGMSKLDSVISCESGWNRNAVSSSGSYVGLAQHALRYWSGRVGTYEPNRWDLADGWRNSRTHLVVTVRMVRAVGWGPWGCA